MTTIIENLNQNDLNNLDDLNNLNYGIDDIVTETTNEFNHILKDDEMINPFYITINNKNNLRNMDDKELYKTYHNLFVLCPRNINNTDLMNIECEAIFKNIITKTEYDNLASYYVLIKCSTKLLRNKLHYNSAKIIDKKYLTPFNSYDFELSDEVGDIIVPILRLKENIIMQKYDVLYDSKYNIQHVFHTMKIYNAFNCDTYKFPLQKRLSDIMLNVTESEYWTNSFNCTSLDITRDFLTRILQYKENLQNHNSNSITILADNKITNTEIDKTVEKLKQINNDSDYLQFIHKKQGFLDIATVLKNNLKRTYYVKYSDHDIYTKEQISQIFDSITSEKELYDMFNMFLLSKDFCHLVINNEKVLRKMTPIIQKYLPIYRYLFGYAWSCMYVEECIFKTRTINTMRHVFSIDVASQLPFFPYATDDLHMTPYMTLFTSKASIDSQNNCLGLPIIMDYKDYGIDTLQGFQTKFNIFTTGKQNVNLFDGINWNNYAVSGSIMLACLLKRSPLMDKLIHPKNISFEEHFKMYTSEYYSGADIDLMSNQKSLIEFMDSVQFDICPNVKKNLELVHKVSVNLIVNPVKSLMLILTKLMSGVLKIIQ